MKNKLGGIFTIAALSAAALPAFADSPLYQFSDGTALYALCSASAQFNDNIYLNRDKDSDVILTVTPGLEIAKGGEKSESSVKFTVKEDLVMYMNDDGNNYQATHAHFIYRYAGSKLNASVAAGFDAHETSTSRDSYYTRGEGELVRYYTYYARTNGSYKLTEKVSVSSGFSWTGTTYDNHKEYYNDRQTYAIPLNLYHSVITEKFNAGLSYEYRYTDLSASNQQKGWFNPGIQQVHFFGVSAVGELSEKLSLDGRVGYTTSDYSRRTSDDDRESTLGLNIAANYKFPNDRTTARLALNRDFEIAGNGEDITSTGASLNLNHRVDSQWSLNSGLSYRRDDYNDRDRCDDIYTASVGANYQINDWVGVNGSYRFQWDDSNEDSMRYTNNIVTLSLNFRY